MKLIIVILFVFPGNVRWALGAVQEKVWSLYVDESEMAYLVYFMTVSVDYCMLSYF